MALNENGFLACRFKGVYAGWVRRTASNAHIGQWLVQVANVRVHATTRERLNRPGFRGGCLV
jgi:transposase